MISSTKRADRRDRGQALVETIIVSIVFWLAICGGGYLLLKCLGKIMAIHQAATHSVCLAQGRSEAECQKKVKNTLTQDLAFHHVQIKSRITRGIIHSEISGQFTHENPEGLKGDVEGRYDLGPSEYKRVLE